MDLNLRGRTAIITGSSQGIGLEIARRLVEEGANVTLCARDESRLRAAEAELKLLSLKVVAESANLESMEDCQRVVRRTAEVFRGIDILVNNVGGIARFAPFEELGEEDWIACFRLNLLSAVHATRASLPWLLKSPAPAIVNIASITGAQPGDYNPHYSSMKAGLINLSKHLSKPLRLTGLLENWTELRIPCLTWNFSFGCS